MRPPRFSLLPWVIMLCHFILGPCHCVASQKKTFCHVEDGRADCSHLSLKAIPAYLPRNITSLDVSHNILVELPPASLTPYQGLIHLDVGYNSIKTLDEGLCQTLALLQTLNVEHNQVHLLKVKDLSHCTSLIWLNMASNRLKLQGEPFSALQVQLLVIYWSVASFIAEETSWLCRKPHWLMNLMIIIIMKLY